MVGGGDLSEGAYEQFDVLALRLVRGEYFFEGRQIESLRYSILTLSDRVVELGGNLHLICIVVFQLPLTQWY